MVAHGRAFWSSGSLQQAFHSLTIHRQLNGSGTGNDDNNISGHGDSDVIRSTLRLYGSVFLVVFLMFCWLRRRFPRRFNVRSWAPKVKSELANDQHGFISWMWKVWKVSDDEIREECGLDALCYLRALQLGFRLSCVGMVNSIWLLPLYSTAEESNKASQITDKIARITVGNIPPGSPRFLGTVLAAYIFFGFTMHFILIEFRWFTKHRHHFLLNFNPRNYSVYVRNIPEEYRSSGELQQLFRRIFSTEAVLQAHVALFIAGLDKKVDQRKALITKLEHAIALKNLTGISPTHSQRWLSGRSDRIDSIEAYTIELELLNADISDQVNTYARARRPKLPYSQTALASSRHLCQKEVGREKQRVPLLNHQNGSSLLNPDEVEILPQSYTREMESMGTEIGNDPLAIPDELPTIDTVNIETMNHSKSYMAALKKVFAFLISAASSKIKGAAQLSSAVATNAIRSTEGLTHSAMSMLGKDAEGRNRDAGFVTFTTLRSTHIAIQNIQHSEPFVLDIEPAPDPSEIFWDNVGRPLHQVQAGKLVSVGMTVGLCLFWTIPVSLIVSLTQVESLKDTITFLYKWVQRWPWIEELLALIAPLMLLILNSTILPLILRAICKLEYPVALSTLEASSFVKMTSFVVSLNCSIFVLQPPTHRSSLNLQLEIIQTFFVSAISGTLTAELTNILKDPESIVNFLAISLPGTFCFTQQVNAPSNCLYQPLSAHRQIHVFLTASHSLNVRRVIIRAHACSPTLPSRYSETHRVQPDRQGKKPKRIWYATAF